MTVAESLESQDVDLTTTTGEPMHPQAATELAQELALVSRALFAQLVSGAATYALSGVPGIGPDRSTPAAAAAVPVAEVAVPMAEVARAVEAIPVPVPMPVPVAVPVVVPAAVASLQVPSLQVPTIAVPTVPVTREPEREPAFEPPAASAVVGIPVPSLAAVPSLAVVPPVEAEEPQRPEHRSMAMLAELGFLDE